MSHGAASSLLVDLLLGREVAAFENVLCDFPNVTHVDVESSLVDLLDLAVESSGSA